jgi:DNA-binding CsgD family transcriptional regulator
VKITQKYWSYLPIFGASNLYSGTLFLQRHAMFLVQPFSPNSLNISNSVSERSSVGRYDLTLSRNLMDTVSHGIGLIDTDLKVLLVNRHAQSTMRRFGEELSTECSLNAGSYSAQMAKLIQAVRQAHKGIRQLVLLQYREEQLAVALSPVELALGHTIALLTTERVDSCDYLSLVAFGRAFELTQAEIRVLEALGRGQDPADAATTLKITVSTIRTHIRSIIGKTGASCLRSLLLRVSKLPPLSISPTAGCAKSLLELGW